MASPPPAGGPLVSISKVTMSGALALSYARCAGPAYRTLTGGLTTKEKTAHGTAKVAVGPGPAQVIWGSWSWVCNSTGTVSVSLPAVQAGAQLPAVQVSGPFAGTDGGASSKVVLNRRHLLFQQAVVAGRRQERQLPRDARKQSFPWLTPAGPRRGSEPVRPRPKL